VRPYSSSRCLEAVLICVGTAVGSATVAAQDAQGQAPAASVVRSRAGMPARERSFLHQARRVHERPSRSSGTHMPRLCVHRQAAVRSFAGHPQAAAGCCVEVSERRRPMRARLHKQRRRA
jgi:hypothetical protein